MRKAGEDTDILISLKEPDPLVAEQYRVLYTRFLQFRKNRRLQVIGISSAIQREGKTTVAFNLAMTMAKEYHVKTLLVEGDTRKPTFRSFMQASDGLGLVQALAGLEEPSTLLKYTLKRRLAVLEAGRVTMDTTALFTQKRLKGLFEALRDDFEFILIDTPPVLPLAEMNILGEVVDGILFVVQADRTPRSFVHKALSMLPSQKVIGLVLNNIKTASPFPYHDDYLR